MAALGHWEHDPYSCPLMSEQLPMDLPLLDLFFAVLGSYGGVAMEKARNNSSSIQSRDKWFAILAHQSEKNPKEGIPSLAMLFFVLVCVAWCVWPSCAQPSPITVQGNRLTDASGKVVTFKGVDRSGFEFACAQGPRLLRFACFFVTVFLGSAQLSRCRIRLQRWPRSFAPNRTSCCFFSDQNVVDAASVSAISAWNVNVVRVPLNEVSR
jgi:hypothetical protein